ADVCAMYHRLVDRFVSDVSGIIDQGGGVADRNAGAEFEVEDALDTEAAGVGQNIRGAETIDRGLLRVVDTLLAGGGPGVYHGGLCAAGADVGGLVEDAGFELVGAGT